MADHPLKPATDHSLGGHLPRQLANQTQAHPLAPEFSRIPFQVRSYGVLVVVSNGYSPVTGRLLTRYAPFRRSPARWYCYLLPLPLDLHVLSLPLAFILSQDQTLHCIFLISLSLTRTFIFSPVPLSENRLKKLTLSFILFLVLASCTPSNSRWRSSSQSFQ